MSLLSTEMVEKIYDAALDSSGWQVVLDRVADFYDASVAVLMCHDHIDPRHDIHVHVRNPEEIQQRYLRDYFLDGDIWYQIARQNWPQHSVLIGEEHISDNQLRKTAFYQDILKPADCGQQLSGSIAADSLSTRALAVSRPFTSKRFSQADKHSMGELIRHLQRAFQIHEKITREEKQKNLLDTLLSMTNTAALVCTTRGKLVFANSLAETTLRKAEGLMVSGGQLLCHTQSTTGKLHDSFKKVRTLGSALIDIDSADLSVVYRLTIFPIEGDRHDIHHQHELLGVFIQRAAEKAEPATGLLQKRFNLTGAENGIAQMLYQGLTPAQIAGKKDVQISTVRTQLHRLFEKTGTRNQAQLVRLIAESQLWLAEKSTRT